MALPDISFTNNLGSVTFKRAAIDVATEYQWDGRNAVRRKRVGVEAVVMRGEAERLTGVLTTAQAVQGKRGDLTLPWTVLKGVRLEGFDTPPNAHMDVIPVSASFVDDAPANNIYKMSFFGLDVQNPRLSIPIPVKETTDNYAQVPYKEKGEVVAANPWYGPVRYRSGYGLMQISLGGTILLQDGLLPKDLVQKLQHRVGVGGVSGDLPTGYPGVFALGDAIPELKGSIALTNVFVTRAIIQWSVERQAARVTVNMAAQPQAWAKG